MIPTADERLASVIRSLTEVVMTHLPPEASLAQEQVQLAIGHLQILRLQFDASPGFEAEEVEDARALAAQLDAAVEGGAATAAALEALRASAMGSSENLRGELSAIHRAVEDLVRAVSVDGAAGAKPALARVIIEHERGRVDKDRRWFLPYGFDTMEASR